MSNIVLIVIVAAIGLLLVLFAPMYQLNESLDTLIITPATSNNTPMVAYNGTVVYQMNEIQHFIMANLWLILVGIMIVLIIKNVTSRQQI